MGDSMNFENPFFILGAGFNIDLNCDFPRYYSPFQRYPLVSDLGEICYNENVNAEEIEEKLGNDWNNGDYRPLEKLCNLIRACDNLVANKIHNPDYEGFFNRFKESKFLTYNYDLVAEIHLARQGTWSPNGGFGVTITNATEATKSISMVYHVHGACSLLPYIALSSLSGTMRTLKPNPEIEYTWDPQEIIATLPNDICPTNDHFNPVGAFGERSVPPIAGKVTNNDRHLLGLQEAARSGMKGASAVVAIGYSFKLNDRNVHYRFIQQLEKYRLPLLVVDPNAEDIVAELKDSHSIHEISAFSGTFKDWYCSTCGD